MTDRRSLLDDDATPTRDGVNIFDDGFVVEDFDLIADGFRPPDRDRRRTSRVDQAGPSIQSVAAQYASGPVTPTGMSRNSTRKSRTRDNPFASPEDEAGAPLVRTPSGNFATSIPRRSVSSASSTQYAGSRSSRLGAGGPSHPYGMYAQGTIARTPSVTTTSTVRPQRPSSSRNGPQHPYALYTQGVGEDFDDDDGDAEAAQNPVPVGFTGVGQSYRRQRGPDGEEQDIIGVYGHAEQLPPYSRYPEDGPEKMALLDVPSPPTTLHSRAPVFGTDPGMPLMHTQLRPTQSMTDQSQLQGQPSSASRLSMLSRGEAESTEDSLPSNNKSWSEKSWKEKKKTRICGIPFWWLLVVGGVAVFIFAVLSGSVAGYMEGVKQQKHHTVTVVSTSLYDASLIATPTTGSPPTGTFSLSFGLPQETEAACLSDVGQQAAWNCGLGGIGETTIIIGPQPDQNQSGAFLGYAPPSTPANLDYGSQISYMTTRFSPFLMVVDNDDPEFGNAFYFQQNYNKMVVLQEGALDTGSGKIKRASPAIPKAWSDQKQVATPGDKPWFCFWNDTFLEGFIYPNQPAHTTPLPIFPTMTSTSYNSTIPSSGSTTSTPAYTSTTAGIMIAPTVTITTTLTMPSTTCTYSGAYSDYHPWLNQNYPDYTPAVGNDDSGTADNDGPQKRYDNYVNYVAEETPLYPYLVKIEERRLQGATPAYCVQYQVLDNGKWNVVTDASGQQIVVPLSETDPPYSAYQSAGIAGSRRRLKERRNVPGACHCQWMSGQQ